MDLPAVAYECKRDTDKKRLAQFPIRVQKVKRLRRQITELNRALRREKENAEFWLRESEFWRESYSQSTKQTDEAISIITKANDTAERWEKMYQSANSRAAAWQRTVYTMSFVGLMSGLMVGLLGSLLLTWL
jgi:hypothetical protein